MKSAVMVGSGVGVKLSNPSSHPQSAEREFFLIPISSAYAGDHGLGHGGMPNSG